jgi:UDP-2-acetamido-3-amino-2,3-dideoxy-glucuronate N-acetyltransferase
MSVPAQIHPSAIVDQPCEIGEGSHIWHFSHICADAVIGRDCNLGQNVMVAGGVRIGSRVKIQNNVSIYAGTIIEDDVFLGPSCVFTNVAHPRAHVPRKPAYATTLVGRGATIGANATIVCGVTIGVTIGAYAFVGAGAVVTRDVAPHALVVGVPARRTGWACRCGEPLPPHLACERCADAYALAGGGLALASPAGYSR